MTITCNPQEALQGMYIKKRNALRDDLAKWKIYMKLVTPQIPDLSFLATREDTESWLNSYTYPPALSLPFDRLLKEEITQVFLDAEWTLEEDRIADDKTAMFTTFLPPETPDDYNSRWYFSVNYSIHMSGSACKRVKVGTETVEETIWEVQCLDDIADRELVAG